MPLTIPLCAEGTDIAFGTTSFDTDLVSLRWTGITRADRRTTHLNSAVVTGSTEFRQDTYKPGCIVNFGEMEIGYFFDPDDDPPIDQPEETITVTWPKTGMTTAGTWAYTGYMNNVDPCAAELDGQLVSTARIKVAS